MEQLFTIKNDDELSYILDAIRLYRMKQMSLRDNLVDTHWKKLSYDEDGSIREVNYYVVVSEKINKRFTLNIGKWGSDDYHISTYASMSNLNAIDDKYTKLIFLSKNTFVEETSKILLNMG